MLKITIILFIPAAGLHAVCCVATPSFNGVEDLRSKINFWDHLLYRHIKLWASVYATAHKTGLQFP